MELCPLDDIVIVRRDEPESITRGGIIIPETAQKDVDQGTIIAKGPGKRSEIGTVLPMDIKVGDKILFSKYANLELKWNGETLITMREADIIGVIED